MKWWLEDGQKKFKNFCFVSASKPHDYRLVWTDTDTYRKGYIPATTTTTGTVTIGNRTGTYSETSTTNAGRETEFGSTAFRETVPLVYGIGVAAMSGVWFLFLRRRPFPPDVKE